MKKVYYKAPARFELAISCLLDRRFNQLSHGAKLVIANTMSSMFTNYVGYKKKSNVAQRGARTHDPEIKSLMLYRLS